MLQLSTLLRILNKLRRNLLIYKVEKGKVERFVIKYNTEVEVLLERLGYSLEGDRETIDFVDIWMDIHRKYSVRIIFNGERFVLKDV